MMSAGTGTETATAVVTTAVTTAAAVVVHVRAIETGVRTGILQQPPATAERAVCAEFMRELTGDCRAPLRGCRRPTDVGSCSLDAAAS